MEAHLVPDRGTNFNHERGKMPNLEFALLYLLTKSKEYGTLYFKIYDNILLSDELKRIYKYILKYYKTYTHHDYISKDEFLTYFLSENPVLKQKDQYIDLINRIYSQDISESLASDVMRKYAANIAAEKICQHLMPVLDGSDPERVLEVSGMLDEYRETVKERDIEESPFILEGIEELFRTEVQTPGLTWPLDCLNNSIGPLRGGTLGHIFARVECLGKGTKVLMYTGHTKNVEDIEVGQWVMGPDSNPRTVTGVTKGEAELYRVSYGWGDSFVCTGNHILTLSRSGAEGIHKYGDKLEVRVSDYISWPEGRKDRYKAWKTGVDFPETTGKTINPYILGVWLGDGCSEEPSITNMDHTIINHWSYYGRLLDLTPTIRTGDTTGRAVTVYLANKGGMVNFMGEWLKDLNLIKNKHIPHNYKTGSRWERLNVLAGLIDTDGSLNKNKNSYEITQKRKVLAEDIVFVARSLGFHSTMFPKKVNGTTYWRVGIHGGRLTEIPVKLKHKKANRTHSFPKRKGLQFGFNVESIGVGEYYGFNINDDSLFLLDDFTVTHNSGKTTLLAHIMTHAASQLSGDEVILGIFNEDKGRRIKIRMYESALGYSETGIQGELYGGGATTIEDRFKMVGGARILLRYNPNATVEEIQSYLEIYPVRLLVVDIADHVKFRDASDKKVEFLEELYRRFRVMAGTYNCDVITVGQADASVAGKKTLFVENMNNSKTGKPGALDWAIGIGATYDPGEQELRWINVVKNKLNSEGGCGPFTVRIDKSTGRYYNF